jgi:amidase
VGTPRSRPRCSARGETVAVARLRAAAAVILAKTNAPFALGDPQTYNAIYGTTNICDRWRRS